LKRGIPHDIPTFDFPSFDPLTGLFHNCGAATQRLFQSVTLLERAAALLQGPPLEGEEWFELLRQKLLPQLTDDSFLVAAVVGGTNIGKSVIFNHLAGCKASATSPLASGTKHPVCLVPPGFAGTHDLAAIFEGFSLREWRSKDEALRETGEHLLFWRTSEQTPENLLVLDTPDIDSDAPVNWQRADHVRRCADVLIAVLTQQKYNDAAVKQFFRRAAEEDKAVIVVFNQCLLPEDEDYWPVWLETFCRETGIEPEIVYVAPNDRPAAEENRLAFFERDWRDGRGESEGRNVEGRNVEESGASATRGRRSEVGEPGTQYSVFSTQYSNLDADRESTDHSPLTTHHSPVGTRNSQLSTLNSSTNALMADLSHLRFEDVKLRTLRGSLRQLLDDRRGVPAWLRELTVRSGRFQSAAELLSSEKIARLDNWPSVSNSLLVTELRAWWQQQREGWAKKVHGFYNAVGTGLTWPFRFAKQKLLQSEPTPPFEQFRKQEWGAILKTVEDAYDRLAVLSDAGNPLLEERLKAILGGEMRSRLLQTLETEHAEFDLAEQLRDTVHAEMQTFREESPRLYGFFKKLDKTAAAVRPMTSVVLFLTGAGPGGDAAAHIITDSALQTVVHVAGDVAGGTVAAAVGDQAVSGTAAGSLGYIEAKFRKLHAAFTARRLEWLLERLRTHLWGTLLEELAAGATIRQTEEYQAVQAALDELSSQLTMTTEKAVVE
jgi:50S ribosome-binding GTPase